MPKSAPSTGTLAETGAPFDLEGPLVVDLDGTLVRIDTLPESWVMLLKQRPLSALMSLSVLMQGRSHFKRYISARVQPDPQLLPYRIPLLALLEAESAKKRPIFLVTGADQSLATSVANHLGIFSIAAGSSPGTNLTGSHKLDWIRKQVGDGPFVYAGDSSADNLIWRHCKQAIPLGPAAGRTARLQQQGVKVYSLPPDSLGTLASLIRLLRPHHWIKNALVFAPAFLAHRIAEPPVFGLTTLSFAAMCIMASAFYIVNDVFDIEADRLHKRKRNRPLANGAVSIGRAAALLCALLGLQFVVLRQLPAEAILLVLCYGIVSLAYSFFLKQFLFMDVLMLAGMFTLRILVGGQASGIQISKWTLAFSLFIFLSLALVKRMNELRALSDGQEEQLSSRGYLVRDTTVISALGAASSYAAVLVFFLYLNSASSNREYTHPDRLWLLGPVFVYWLSRFWILSNRGFLHDDPIVFAFRDRASLICVLAALAIVYSAL